MSFRLVPKSVTLNKLERRNGVILHYFIELVYVKGKKGKGFPILDTERWAQSSQSARR